MLLLDPPRGFKCIIRPITARISRMKQNLEPAYDVYIWPADVLLNYYSAAVFYVAFFLDILTEPLARQGKAMGESAWETALYKWIEEDWIRPCTAVVGDEFIGLCMCAQSPRLRAASAAASASARHGEGMRLGGERKRWEWWGTHARIYAPRTPRPPQRTPHLQESARCVRARCQRASAS